MGVGVGAGVGVAYSACAWRVRDPSACVPEACAHAFEEAHGRMRSGLRACTGVGVRGCVSRARWQLSSRWFTSRVVGWRQRARSSPRLSCQAPPRRQPESLRPAGPPGVHADGIRWAGRAACTRHVPQTGRVACEAPTAGEAPSQRSDPQRLPRAHQRLPVGAHMGAHLFFGGGDLLRFIRLDRSRCTGRRARRMQGSARRRRRSREGRGRRHAPPRHRHAWPRFLQSRGATHG